MPFVATTLLQASEYTSERVALENRTATQVLTQFTAFNDQFTPLFDANSVNERTIRNWLVEARLIQNELPAAGTLNPSQRQRVIEVVVRICYATVIAALDGRATAGDVAAVLAVWNATFGAVP